MLIVACQMCGETVILPGTPDSDGIARVSWTCKSCGVSQVLQLSVSSDGRANLRKIVGGMSFCEETVASSKDKR
ncbi:MAG TPA: alcohol dehydrogenase [Synergistaceae bacterium]|jgi:hypothetical protein|nr:MAG: Uncharacterized protein XD80_0174 [Synergistales bacterium 53_16]KUL03029.1 MAG: Uncharacterized protein XE12_0596 [Synergistales bacterium 54_9]MDK2845664.1 hypothetical protein [Synergistales bacterium]HAA47894.1 alcohol dehydrogenase [Synergistaceae bacterium]MDN5336414.1 hypothetical protein [Synergistales bacterium]